MKTTGFLVAHEQKILGEAITYLDSEDGVTIDERNLASILRYLEAGKIIFAMTLSIQDKAGDIIAPYEVYTDGEWVWPRYYSYYIEKKEIISISLAFLRKMESIDFSIPKVSIEQLSEAQIFFESILIKNNLGFKKHVKSGNRSK
jgi:hypothetical protein